VPQTSAGVPRCRFSGERSACDLAYRQVRKTPRARQSLGSDPAEIAFNTEFPSVPEIVRQDKGAPSPPSAGLAPAHHVVFRAPLSPIRNRSSVTMLAAVGHLTGAARRRATAISEYHGSRSWAIRNPSRVVISRNSPSYRPPEGKNATLCNPIRPARPVPRLPIVAKQLRDFASEVTFAHKSRRRPAKFRYSNPSLPVQGSF